VARIVAISTDLLLGSKVEAMLKAAGHEVTLAPSVPPQLEDVDLLVADLDAEDPRALTEPGIPVLGYYSHVDVEAKKAAEAAGIARAEVSARDGATVREIATVFLEKRGVDWSALPPVRFAVNETIVADDHVPQDGDRVAVLAPFAGG